MQKLILFGAGKIGRSFIAQLFYKGGYEVVFVDINQKLIQLLNSIKQYDIIIKGENTHSLTVTNYRAIHLSEKEKLIQEFSTASIVATSVGLNALPELFPVLADALIFRFKQTPYSPIDIIIAENIRNADELFSENLKKYLPGDYPFDKLVGLVETSIGKMVPIMSKKDLVDNPLQIFTEEYNSLPLAAKGFKNPLPEISGLKYMTNIKAIVDRKSLIHNLGHAAAAYYGYLAHPNKRLLWEVLSDKKVMENTRNTMIQSAKILLRRYPYNFTLHDLKTYIDDLLRRFQNRALGDTIFRVGCDLYRKLGKDDRLAGAVHLALDEGLEYDKILEALVSGFHFMGTDENDKMFPADVTFAEEQNENGFENHFENITGLSFSKYPEIHEKVQQINRQIYNNNI